MADLQDHYDQPAPAPEPEDEAAEAEPWALLDMFTDKHERLGLLARWNAYREAHHEPE